jgi:hypothetical protein
MKTYTPTLSQAIAKHDHRLNHSIDSAFFTLVSIKMSDSTQTVTEYYFASESVARKTRNQLIRQNEQDYTSSLRTILIAESYAYVTNSEIRASDIEARIPLATHTDYSTFAFRPIPELIESERP